MTHRPEKVAEVRASFLAGASLSEAARRAGVDTSTALRWRARVRTAGDPWEAQRAAPHPAALARIEAALIDLRRDLAADAEAANGWLWYPHAMIRNQRRVLLGQAVVAAVLAIVVAAAAALVLAGGA